MALNVFRRPAVNAGREKQNSFRLYSINDISYRDILRNRYAPFNIKICKLITDSDIESVILNVSDFIFADFKVVLWNSDDRAAMISSLVFIFTPICYVEFVTCELVNTFLKILRDFLERSHPAIADVS